MASTGERAAKTAGKKGLKAGRKSNRINWNSYPYRGTLPCSYNRRHKLSSSKAGKCA